MEIEEIKELMKSLSLSDTEKRDQINIAMLYSHIKWLEEHIKWLERSIDKLGRQGAVAPTPNIEEPDANYSSIINTQKRARIFQYLLQSDKAKGEKIALYVGSDPNYISYFMNQLVRKGLVVSPSRGTFRLPADKETRKYISGLVSEILE